MPVFVFLGFALSVLLALGSPGLAQDPVTKPIEGDFRLTEGQCKGQKSPCTINFEIRGEVAKTIYDHMLSEPAFDACADGLLKTDDGTLACYKTGAGYFCDVGYDFVKKRLVQSDVTC